MTDFYGTLSGGRGNTVTKCATGDNPIKAVVASCQGAVETKLTMDSNSGVIATITLIPWHGSGITRLLYQGPIDLPSNV
jgi:hypothetical protein